MSNMREENVFAKAVLKKINHDENSENIECINDLVKRKWAWTSEKYYFDAGVEAERERVIAAIKKARNPFEFSDLFQELFPDQQDQRSE